MQHSKKEKDILRGGKQDALISPLSGAESLFLGASLETSDITAAAMLEQLEQNGNKQYHPKNSSGRIIEKAGSFRTAQGSTVSADDFMSCVESASDLDSVDSDEKNPSNSHFTLRPFRIFSTNSDTTTMASKKKTTTKKAVPKAAPIDVKLVEKPVEKPLEKPVETPVEVPPPADEPMKVDAAEMVYGKAKGIWAWGKSVPVVSFFVGTSEAVAGKALGVVGTDLSALDTTIEGELTKFDSGVLTPAVGAIAKILMGVAGKSEETLKPIIMALLKPLGFLIKSEASEESPEAHTETPEVTVAK